MVEPGEPDRVPVMPVLVEKEAQDLGVTSRYGGHWSCRSGNPRKSEVRVDSADDMEHVSKRIPEERMQPRWRCPWSMQRA